MKRLMIVAAITALLVAGCGAAGDDPAAPPAGATGPAAAPADVEPLLAAYGLGGKDAVQIVDHLDRLNDVS